MKSCIEKCMVSNCNDEFAARIMKKHRLNGCHSNGVLRKKENL